MKKTIATTIIATLAMTTLLGCSSEKPVEGTPAVKVNGETITQETIDSRFRLLCSGYGLDPEDENASVLKDSVVEGIINEKLLLQEAANRGFKASKSEVKELVDEVVDTFPSKEDFEKNLKEQNGMTMEEFEQMAEEQVLFDALMDDLVEDKTVDAKAFYEENKERYNMPERIQARHILVDTEEEAKDIIAQLEAGADFAQLAKEKSKDTVSGANGGELGGFFDRTKMVAPFSEAAFALGVGEMSKEPVKTDFGYHIIKVEDKKAAGYTPFEEVEEDITDELMYYEEQDAYAILIEELRGKAEIEYLNQPTQTDDNTAAPEEQKAPVATDETAKSE